MPDSAKASRTVAGIVLFQPDPDVLFELIAIVQPQVSVLYLFENGPLSVAVEKRLSEIASRASRIASLRNVGSASALNGLAERASHDGADVLVLFDQDSHVERNHVARLVAAHDRLSNSGERPAVVGPTPRLGEGERKAPCYPAVGTRSLVDGVRPVGFLATSGSLLDLQVWRAIGRFRDDFFIDAVDTEWCFRAWARGFSCWVDGGLPMLHRVGEGVIRLPVLGRSMPRQKLFRMETYLRNNIYCWRLRHVPLGWKLRQVAYLPAQAAAYWLASGGRCSIARALLRGVADGLSGRLGPPRGFV